MTQSSLYDKILKYSNYINKMSRSGASNYIITSGQVSQAISEIMEEKQYKRIVKLKRIFNKYE
jgi:gas vesicle protein